MGTISLDLWDVEIRIERFKVSDKPPLWLFSPRTVENIDRLYKVHGPGPIVQYLPQFAKIGIVNNSSLWHWSILITVGLLAVLCGWLIQTIMVGALQRVRRPKSDGIAEAASGPLALLSAAVVFNLVTFSLFSLPGPIAYNIRPIVSAIIIIAFTWFGVRAVRILSDLASQRYLEKIMCEGECDARSRVTRLSVVKHVLTFIALCVGFAVTLRELNLFETLSLSLLASAGAASVILGVAAHSVLGNIMAGIQIALSQPACIGDSICFEGHWGVVEEITYTYITIRTWDSRRVVVPLAHFISHPFENWSMKSAHTITPIYLYVDYKTDVKTVRAKFKELLAACDDWDRQSEPVLEVTSLKGDTIELRALCSAKDPPSAWRLHCRLREELIAYMRELEGGRFLPTHRLALQQDAQPIAANPHSVLSNEQSDAANIGTA